MQSSAATSPHYPRNATPMPVPAPVGPGQEREPASGTSVDFAVSARQQSALTPSTRPLFREFARSTGALDITKGFVNPTDAAEPPERGIVNTRGDGFSIYREIEDDDMVKTVISQRSAFAVAPETEVIPGGPTDLDIAAAESIARQLKQINFDAVLKKMWMAIFNGYAFGECIWYADLQHDEVALRDIRVKNIERFFFTNNCEPRLATNTVAHEGVKLPPRKFWWLTTGDNDDDNPYGLGLAHFFYWLVRFKKNVLRFYLLHIEKFGSPTMVGKYAQGSADEKIDGLLSTLSLVQTDAAIVIPKEHEWEKIETSGSASTPHQDFIDWSDRAIAKVGLAQTLTTDATGGQYKADVHKEMLRLLAISDISILLGAFNRTVARWLTDWNYGGAAYPQVVKDHGEAKDLQMQSAVDKALLEMGWAPTSARIAETYGKGYEQVDATSAFLATSGNAPTPAVQIVGANPPPPPASDGVDAGTMGDAEDADATEFAEDLTPREQAQLDEALDSIAAQDLGEMGEQLLQPILNQITSGASAQRIRDNLERVYTDLNTKQLEEAMRRATFVAATWGRQTAQAGR